MELTEKCSLYKPYFHKKHLVWCMSTKPEQANLIDMLTTPSQIELVDKIRANENKDERTALKKQLWAITPSSVAEGGRGEKYVKERNGLMAFDIDKYNDEPITLDHALEILNWVKSIPYTLYCSRSASGRGVWGLFRVSNPDRHAEHFDAMEESFKSYGLAIDPAPRNIASLRFLAYDTEAFFNADAKVFENIKEPEVKAYSVFATPTNKNKGKSDGKELVNKFNSECTTQDMYTILENFGFQYHSTSGNKIRFTRPGKETKAGLSVDYHSDKRTLYSFSSEVPFLDKWKAEKSGGWSCSPITALLIYGFGGTEKEHWAKAFNYLKNK